METGGYFLKQGFGRVTLQRCCHRTCQMDGEIGDEEIDGLRTTEDDDLTMRHRGSTRLHPLVQRGVTDRLVTTDDS